MHCVQAMWPKNNNKLDGKYSERVQLPTKARNFGVGIILHDRYFHIGHPSTDRNETNSFLFAVQ